MKLAQAGKYGKVYPGITNFRRGRTTLRTLRRKKYRKRIRKGIGFSKIMNFKFKLTDTFGVTNGTFIAYSLSLNWLFNPTWALGTAQPMYRDQMAAIYKNYRVYGCKVSMTFVNLSTTQNLEIFYVNGLYASNPANMEEAKQLKGCIFRMLGTAASPKARTTIKSYANIKRILGPRFYDDNWQSENSNNPWSIAKGLWGTQNIDSTTGVDYKVYLKMVFYTHLYNLIDIGES